MLIEKKFDRAIQYLREALALNQNDSEILVMLGNILHEHKNSKQAIKYYKIALKQNPEDVKALVCIGATLFEKHVRDMKLKVKHIGLQ